MVLLHLSLALLAVDIIVLAGVDQTSNYGGCCAVAAPAPLLPPRFFPLDVGRGRHTVPQVRQSL